MMANNEETSALYDEAGPPKNYVPRRRRSSLFSQLLPEPSRPRSSLRSLSTGILVAFLCFIVWTALVGNSTGSTGAQAEQGWVHYAGVSDWARMDPSRFDFNGEDTFKEKGRPSAVGVGEETTTDEEVDTSRALSMRVAEAVEDGTVSKYRWHAQLSTRNTSVGDAGRMIVVGDVHGMHASLTSVSHPLSTLAANSNELRLDAQFSTCSNRLQQPHRYADTCRRSRRQITAQRLARKRQDNAELQLERSEGESRSERYRVEELDGDVWREESNEERRHEIEGEVGGDDSGRTDYRAEEGRFSMAIVWESSGGGGRSQRRRQHSTQSLVPPLHFISFSRTSRRTLTPLRQTFQSFRRP